MEHIHTYQQILEAQLLSVMAELNDIAIFDEASQDWIINTTDLDHTEADENNLADAAEAADERVAILAELENRYHLINLTLEKIQKGTYGICEISGDAIETARLDVNPTARTCTHHMETEYELPLP